MPPIKKSLMEKDLKMIDVGQEELLRRDVIFHLGELVAAALTSVGQITMFKNPDGNVCIANPVHVYMAPGAVLEDEGDEVPPFHWVRPILTSGRPQYAAWRDGQLWEIEFDGEPPPPAGS